MTKTLMVVVVLWVALLGAEQSLDGRYRLVVITVDGLDHRYLRDADALGLRIPTLRRLVREGAHADGVVGLVPTMTWPAHTTMITGVPSWEHGIVSNNQPAQPSERWWYTRFLRVKTLWHVAHERGLTTGAVWWPVTVGPEIDFNLPEYWEDPPPGLYLLDDVAKHSTLGLIDRIARSYPLFRRRGLTDREKVLATRYILEHEQPDLFLLHLDDFDTDQHATGAFSTNAHATLEYVDALLADLLTALPPRTVVAIVSDHGFETQQQLFRPEVLLAQASVDADVTVREGLVGVSDDRSAEVFRAVIGQRDSVVAREIPMADVRRMAPAMGDLVAAFEPVSGVIARDGRDGPVLEAGNGRGTYGLWPTRADYRATFLLWGPPVRPRALPEISMLDFAPTFADILRLELPGMSGTSVWSRVQ